MPQPRRRQLPQFLHLLPVGPLVFNHPQSLYLRLLPKSPIRDSGSPISDTGSPISDTGLPNRDSRSLISDSRSPISDSGLLSRNHSPTRGHALGAPQLDPPFRHRSMEAFSFPLLLLRRSEPRLPIPQFGSPTPTYHYGWQLRRASVLPMTYPLRTRRNSLSRQGSPTLVNRLSSSRPIWTRREGRSLGAKRGEKSHYPTAQRRTRKKGKKIRGRGREPRTLINTRASAPAADSRTRSHSPSTSPPYELTHPRQTTPTPHPAHFFR